jgi:hypothetical protein
VKGINSRAAVLDRTAARIKPEWIDRFGTKTSKYQKYRDRPIAFIEEILGYTLTIEQKLICDRFVVGGQVNVKAAHGVGKSLLAACLTVYNTVVMERETITTAPTFRQVAHVLWKEIRKIRSKIKFAGLEGGQTFLRFGGGSAFGFTAQHNNTDAFQGQHAPGLCGIEDEACGISSAIDQGMLACAVDAESVVLRIGNPTDDRTPFAKHCKNDGAISIPVWNHPNVSWAYDRNHQLHEWVRVAIGLHKGECLPRSQWSKEYGVRSKEFGTSTIEDPATDGRKHSTAKNLRNPQPTSNSLLPTPYSLLNLKDPIPGAIAIEWIERIRYGFTEDSAFWQSRVNAEFPDNVADGIIPKSWLVAARARYDSSPNYWDAIASRYYWQFGVDVADGGGDNHARAYFGGRSVLYGVTTTVPKGDYRDTMHLAGLVVNDVKSYRDAIIAVDNLGVGAGTLGRLLELGHLAQACTFSAAPTRTPKYSTKYANLRTQCYWEFREGLQEQEMAIAPLDGDEELAFEELSAVEYTVNSSGTIVASSKDEVKKKIGRSPDRADAIVMAYWLDPLMRSAESVKVVSDEERLMRESKKSRGVDENLGRLNRVLGA